MLNLYCVRKPNVTLSDLSEDYRKPGWLFGLLSTGLTLKGDYNKIKKAHLAFRNFLREIAKDENCMPSGDEVKELLKELTLTHLNPHEEWIGADRIVTLRLGMPERPRDPLLYKRNSKYIIKDGNSSKAFDTFKEVKAVLKSWRSAGA